MSPYKQEYNPANVKKGGSKTPAKVMGSQGKPAPVKPMFNKSKPTGRKAFGKK